MEYIKKNILGKKGEDIAKEYLISKGYKYSFLWICIVYHIRDNNETVCDWYEPADAIFGTSIHDPLVYEIPQVG